MPSSTEKQRNYIFYLRGKYKTKSDTPEKYSWIWDKDWEIVKERYIPFFKESDIKISANTQHVLRQYMKDKKYISNSGQLKISFADNLDLVVKLKGLYQKTKDENIKRAIEELQDKRFN